MFWSEADVALLVLDLVIPAEALAAALRLAGMEDHLREVALGGLDPLPGGALALVGNDLDGEAGLAESGFIGGGEHLVAGGAVVRQDAVGAAVAVGPQPVGMEAELLADRLVVLQQADLAADELDDPDGAGVGLQAGAADVPIRPK